jgi:Flp pilus assembly protein TadG
MDRSRRFGWAREGTAVLELALTLSLLFLVTFGLVEFGRYYYVANMLEGAAREAARAGIVSGASLSTCNTQVEDQLVAANLVPSSTSVTGTNPFTYGNFTVTYTDSTAGTTISTLDTMPVGDTLTCQITGTWGTVGASYRPLDLIPASQTVYGTTSMRKEGD